MNATTTRSCRHCIVRLPAAIRVLEAAALVALLVVAAGPVSAQTGQSADKVGITARVGWAPTDRIDPAIGIGLELEAFPTRRLVPGIRIDRWDFGIYCTGEGAGDCPSAVTTYAGGVKYRLLGPTRVTPFTGGDIGYMRWTSGASGLSLRARAGADIRLIPHVDIIIDGAVTRYVATTEGRLLENNLVGFTAGLALRI